MSTWSISSSACSSRNRSTRSEGQRFIAPGFRERGLRGIEPRGHRAAFGAPGIEPRWTHGNKDGVGTAYSQDSRVWFTLFRGALTEVYYPLIDHPQTRDLEFLVTDGETFFHEERRDLLTRTERLSDHTLGYRVHSDDPEGRYSIVKEVIASPHQPAVLLHTRFNARPDVAGRLRLFVLFAPHLEVSGWGNNAHVLEHQGATYLAADRAGTWAVLGATTPIGPASAGYVGASDGWTDLHAHHRLTWEFDEALGGNVALVGELPNAAHGSFTLALGFGAGLAPASTVVMQALGQPYDEERTRFRHQWDRPASTLIPRPGLTQDASNLYHASYSLLLAHEDKTFPGAFIASLSIPWGNARDGSDRGGYHFVWTRDLVNTATALLATGDRESPLRTLVYLAARQEKSGGFPQNFWLDGTPFWTGVQLDEVSFPILLARQLKLARALKAFDPFPMVREAVRYLIAHGPATGQERWEEAGGYSPSTLAAHIAALIAGATAFREKGDEATARFVEEYADFLYCHIVPWTVTRRGTLVPGLPRHFVRIQPVAMDDPSPEEDLDSAVVTLANQPPGTDGRFPAREIVDAGFLELVRYGILPADDPVVTDSVAVVDRVLKVETPLGPVWRRYNHDGYGQRADGGPYQGWGQGGAWPLLTAERGHFELAAGRDPRPYLRAMERFASPTGHLPEQVWDGPDQPSDHLLLGRPTGAAVPLAWAHAEYLKLLRSTADGRVFDRIPEVEARYARGGGDRPFVEVWKFNRQPRSIPPGTPLRVLAEAPFRLHVSVDGWRTVEDVDSTATSLGFHFVDCPRAPRDGPLVFTFFWPEVGRWEGRDYSVEVRPA